MSIITPYPVLRELPVSDLSISDLNPRKSVDADGIAALANSIRRSGLMHNLAGLLMGEHVLIVAGGRRLRALQLLRETGEGPETVPVLLTDDIVQARAWAMTENVGRIDLNPADEIAGYAGMIRDNHSVPEIAATFGVTELRVMQRLKLATLPDDLLADLRAGAINLSQAQKLLLCQSDDQREKFAHMARNGVGADQLRHEILRDRVTQDDRRVKFVGLETYRAAGGALASDLFSSDVVIEDVVLLDRLFTEAVEARREEFIADGWRWAEFHAGTYLSPWEQARGMDQIWAQSDDHDQPETGAPAPKQDFTAAQRAVAGLFFAVDNRGRIITERGYVRRDERPEAVTAGVLHDKTPPSAPDTAPADEGTGFSQSLAADLRAIHLSALQEAILAKPGLTRKLLAYGLATSAGRPFDVVISEQPNAPKVTDGWQQAPALEHDGRTLNGWDHAQHMTLDELTLSIANRLIRGMIYGLSFSRTLPEWHELLEDAGADIRARWRPTKENFFSRVTSPYLDALYCRIFDLTADHADARNFAKMKKGEKANLLHMLFDPASTRTTYPLMTDTARARIDSFVPEVE